MSRSRPSTNAITQKKETAYMYPIHLDGEKYGAIKSRLQSKLEITSDPILIHLYIPGIAVTITQMISDKSVNALYVKKFAEDKNQHTDATEDTSDRNKCCTEIVNCTDCPKRGGYTHIGFQHGNQRQSKGAPLMNSTPFKDSWLGCGLEVHHAEFFYFIMKVKQCLAYLKESLKTGQEKAAKFRHQSNFNYKDRRAKIRTL